jgi:hypothetical protein
MESIGVPVPEPAARPPDAGTDCDTDLLSFGPDEPPLPAPRTRRELSEQGRQLLHVALAPAPVPVPAQVPPPPRPVGARSNSAILKLYDKK